MCSLLVLFFVFRKLFAHFIIYVFLRYGEGQNRYHCFDWIHHKLYVSHHDYFLEHILSFLFLLSLTMYLNLNLFTLIISWMTQIVFLQILILWFLIIMLLPFLQLPQHLLRLWIFLSHVLLSVFVSLLNYHILFSPHIQILLHYF